jgi:enamine deaminase RidA (YjgF/YER057c/UK114 family)
MLHSGNAAQTAFPLAIFGRFANTVPRNQSSHQKGNTMAAIERHHSNHRMSQIVTHGDMIYLAGQVAAPGASVTEQTKGILEQIDTLLAEVGSDKEQILQAIIWLADMNDFAEMNAVWDGWVPQGHTPARACGGAPLATPEYKVEVIVTAVRR